VIRYDRSTISVPVALRGSGAGPKERRKNAEHIANKQFEKVKHLAYKHKEVRDALNALFGRKCVFCESSLLGNQPGDIEHFRPKGEVVEVNPTTGEEQCRPGYAWLGACWKNLLLSCADCNRPRRQVDATGRTRTMGKGCYFPLAPGNLRATSAWGVKGERPLLIDPCTVEPDEHLEFTELGGILPKVGSTGASAMGEATIKHCGLDRAELVEMRLRHRRTVMAAIRHIVDALEHDREPGEDLDDLVELLRPTSPYVAFTRHLVRAKLTPYLTALGIVI
jgi:uncharacterized protein (TIGR02646 family)